MAGDVQEAEYYRRRAANEAAVADEAQDAKVRTLHRELATLYEARARLHAERIDRADGVAVAA